ncbi:hypothetical protein MSIMFB_01718 [Mycobacterium simulans]|uniref:Uncharacterized protein n=1 Tax=Mycobacterium simulans TaxID=627089 RepID=A0A7Z7IIQ1_9MYCO|nr:hypothetical protein [Mycobacterium simulans]SOJ54219.1 hypothetical protein MSIMFB_01718 [Mycobacterium simulans]
MLAAKSAIRLDTSKEILPPQVRAAFPATVLAAMIALASRGLIVPAASTRGHGVADALRGGYRGAR